MQQQQVMVALDKISYQYAKATQPSVSNVSLRLYQGRCTGILGPNGAGKSTLISLLCGLLPCQQGELEYSGYANLSLAQAIEQKVALVPQDFAFYDELTVHENVAFFVAISEKKSAKQPAIIAEAIAQCGLEAVAQQRSGTLSGGYKRRLNIAIALSKQPDIIFLDEPTVGIDPISRDAIIDLLIRLKQAGKTLVYTSHLLHEVSQLCDDVVFLRQGQVVAHEAVTQAQLSVSFTTQSPLDTQQLSAFRGALTTHAQGHYSLLINNTKELSQTFLALGQLSEQLTTANFSNNYIDQLYRDLFAEPLC